MRLGLLVLIITAGSFQAQQEPFDSGPPYQLKVLDLIYRVEIAITK